ncbi:hypothetical protein [Thalassomonas sp. RHCl1]|uniref:hypothetical protein n=1 Tax=Thalassomonas sp. RHCl1 TaxID=2995320 RepID=UPI00248D2A34|nr:hypothetical protein [Thalassomonas sp. RHCl1]
MTEAEKNEQFFELWCKYEDMTVHFNGIILKLRIQALALLSILMTTIGIIAKNSDKVPFIFLIFMFLTLCIFWIAIWLLDIKYYNKILNANVDALVKLEGENKNHIIHPILSTAIRNKVKSSLYPNLFYILGSLPIFIGLFWSFKKYVCV